MYLKGTHQEAERMTTSLITDSQRNSYACGTAQTASLERGEWVTQAKCRNGDPDALFVRGAEQRRAAAICRHCPVLLQCRADALDNRVEFGVWGGSLSDSAGRCCGKILTLQIGRPTLPLVGN